MSGSPLLEIREGGGVIIATELEVNRGVDDPIAARLMANILRFLNR
jgi:hypothetical protein